MSIKARVVGNNNQALNLTDKGEVVVVIPQRPFVGEEISAIPFRQYFTDDGIKSGSNTMNVSGTLVSPLDFYITASEDYDIYIKYITVEIGDGGTPSLNKFGALAALTNGVAFYWDTQSEPLYELHEGIKTNKEFIRIASDTGAIGTGTDAYLADVSGGGAEKSYLPNLDVSEIYGLSYGLRLRKGSLDKLIFRVQDDLTGLSTFNAIATGTRI
jgi:hypothetical protein